MSEADYDITHASPFFEMVQLEKLEKYTNESVKANNDLLTFFKKMVKEQINPDSEYPRG